MDLRDRFTEYFDQEQVHYFNEELRKKYDDNIKKGGEEQIQKDRDEWLKNIKAFEIYDFLKEIGVNFSGTVIELGAGHGWLSALVSREPSVSEVYAVDCSEYLVKVASDRMYEYLHADRSKIVSVIGDFHNLDYWKDETFDFVVMDASFHHTKHPEIVLKEASRVLKKSGICLAIRENLFPVFRPGMARKHYEEARKTNTIEQLHHRENIAKMARENRLSVETHLLYFNTGLLSGVKKILLKILNGYFTIWNCVFIFKKI